MSLKEQIDVIIEARKAKCEQLKARKAALATAKTSIRENYTALCEQVGEIEDNKLRAQYEEIVDTIEIGPVLARIDQAARKMDEGIQRFSREYISIATVGKEGQGKSKLLQAIGDLDNDIIPSYDAGSCTGATSIIWNDSSMARGKVRAKITFRQPQDLVELVKPYILTLNPTYFDNRDLEFDDIGYLVPSRLVMKTDKEDANDAKRASAKGHLTNIVKNFHKIKDLFGSSPITLTDPELIKTYVAQNNGKSVDDPELETYYNYLAVARADIYCHFYTDAGKIRLVDTVGIGSTQYGIEDAMLNTVDKECDAAIVMNRPDLRGVQDRDVDLYTSLRNRFLKRDTSQWLFYFVNHFKGRNDNSVGLFYNDVKDKGWKIADCRVVDASDQNAVRDEFMLPMLEILMQNMDSIDKAYLQEIFDAEKQAQNDIRALVAQIPTMQAYDTKSLAGKEAFEKGKKCFHRMTADLSQNVYYWSQERENSNSALWNSVQAILNNLDNIIPSAEQIQRINDMNGTYTGENVWETVLHYVRNEITDRFIAIDNVLERETLEFKNSLVRHLYYELKQLNDTNAVDVEEEEPDMVAWLKDMMDHVLASSPDYNQIRKAFQFLYQFEFNTRAQLIREVRHQMYIINPICAEYAKPTINFRKATCGNEVHFYLTSRMSVIEDELRYHLAKLYRTPNQAFYAAAEEFYDRLTFASDLSGDSITSMSDVWGKFFQEYSSKLWKDDMARYEKVNALVKHYQEMIAALEGYLAKAAG